ncbi:AraC-like DNA-binding protein [Paenibacillus harenae]|uniref:AraC-like DNA-binding protein n=2 Tax=Paenibacillus harenae TaxID=306543 RepID=A0ABT9TXC4_PAEHA|nr:AraC-like DNA-binding protein [Paenibacillus harenae]
MNPTIESIMQNQLNRIHADVIMTAYSQSSAGWCENNAEPDFYRFCYVDKGEGWLEMDHISYSVKRGQLFLMPAGKLQSYGTKGDETFGRYWCHYRLDPADMQFVESQQMPAYIEVKDDREVKQLFTKLIQLQTSQELTRELRMKAALLELFALYFDASYSRKEQQVDASFDDTKWNEVLAYIEQQLHRNIQIEELAKVAFLHPNYFITSFKNMMGCSPIQYVTNRRLALAKRLLVETAEPIAEVARRAGMQNHYLSRLFKRHTGISPNQYRRIARSSAFCQPVTERTSVHHNEEDYS